MLRAWLVSQGISERGAATAADGWTGDTMELDVDRFGQFVLVDVSHWATVGDVAEFNDAVSAIQGHGLVLPVVSSDGHAAVLVLASSRQAEDVARAAVAEVSAWSAGA